MKNHTSIEPLEPRIAPATIAILGKTATWTDHDGDLVTMKWTSTDAPAFTTMDKGSGLLVSRVFLEAAKHDGAAFTVTVKAAGAFGDGRVELGHLDGDGVVLKSWVGAKAAISEVDLGVNNGGAVGTFISGGIGQTKSSYFTGAMGDGQSLIKGSTKLVKINGDIGYGGLFIGTNGSRTHGSIIVTGNLRGNLPGGSFSDGHLDVFGSGNSILLGGSVVDGYFAQYIADFKSVTIKGDIIGDIPSPLNHGYVITRAGKTTIGGSILGGHVYISNDVKFPNPVITVGGSIIARDGVTGTNSGVLTVAANAKSVTVKGSLRGASNATWTDDQSGSFPIAYAAGAVVFENTNNAGTLTIGGSIYAGKIADGKPAVNGGIQVGGNIKSITIGGSVIGSDRAPACILAFGSAFGATGDYNAIGKLTIKGDATHAFIAAGTIIQGNPDNMPGASVFINNPDAGIGSIFIGGNFNTSNVFAGVKDGGSPGVNPINAGDTLAAGDPTLTAKLGPVVIKGHLLSERDAFYYAGFAADSIAKIVVNGRQVFKAGDGLRNFDSFITAREL